MGADGSTAPGPAAVCAPELSDALQTHKAVALTPVCRPHLLPHPHTTKLSVLKHPRNTNDIHFTLHFHLFSSMLENTEAILKTLKPLMLPVMARLLTGENTHFFLFGTTFSPGSLEGGGGGGCWGVFQQHVEELFQSKNVKLTECGTQLKDVSSCLSPVTRSQAAGLSICCQ